MPPLGAQRTRPVHSSPRVLKYLGVCVVGGLGGTWGHGGGRLRVKPLELPDNVI